MSFAVTAAIVGTMLSTLSPGIDADLRDRYAEDIVAAVEGADKPLELAAALAVTAKAEGELSERIEHCRYHVGEADNGRALGLFQLHRQWWGGRTRQEICESNRLSTVLAATALLSLRRSRGSWHAAFRGFVGVDVETDPHLRGRGHNFDRLIANAKRAGS